MSQNRQQKVKQTTKYKARVTVTGSGIVHVDPSTILKSKTGRRQLDALKNIKTINTGSE